MDGSPPTLKDSVDQWPVLSGETHEFQRTNIWLGTGSSLDYHAGTLFKLIGKKLYNLTGQALPRAPATLRPRQETAHFHRTHAGPYSTHSHPPTGDPCETTVINTADNEPMLDQAEHMAGRLSEYSAASFGQYLFAVEPYNISDTDAAALQAAAKRAQGFLAPTDWEDPHSAEVVPIFLLGIIVGAVVGTSAALVVTIKARLERRRGRGRPRTDEDEAQLTAEASGGAYDLRCNSSAIAAETVEA